MGSLLAYHADTELNASTVALALPLCAFVLWRARALPRREGAGSVAGRWLLGLAVAVALVAVPFWRAAAVFVVPLLVPLGLALLAGREARRSGGGDARAAFVVAGLLTAVLVARAVACLASDGCVH